MSGCSYGDSCPNCGENMDVAEDHKPFPHATCQCLNCGIVTFTETDYLSLEELNEARLDYDMEPLEELPMQEFMKKEPIDA